MSIRTMFAALAAVVIAAPLAAPAQENDANFPKARKEFVAGQPRAAANTLLQASLAVREQVGRCRDEGVGVQLMEAESQLEKLAAALRAGSVTSVKTLDAALGKVDRVMALHHLELAVAVAAHPRPDNIPMSARDVERAAFYFERSFTLSGQKPSADQAALLDRARKLSKAIDETNTLPGDAKETLKAFAGMLAEASK